MELQLGLALSLNSTQGSCPDFNFEDCTSLKRKRSYVQMTLPLLSWKHNQPNEEEEEEQDDDNEKHSSTEQYEDEDCGIVGWPPIKSWRKKNQRLVVNGAAAAAGGGERRSSSYVKVKMDGVAIARKIDLNQYNSSTALLSTLLTMFGIDRGEYSNYVMTYQDKEGDWLLANDDDVPWRLFVESAQRLKLQRN